MHQCKLILFCSLATRERCNAHLMECLIDAFIKWKWKLWWHLILADQETQRSTLQLWRKPWTLCVWESRPCTTLSTWPYRRSSQFPWCCFPNARFSSLRCITTSTAGYCFPEGTCQGTPAGRSWSSSAAWPHATQPTSTSWLREDAAQTCPCARQYVLLTLCPLIVPSNRLWSRSRCGCPSSACQRRCVCARCWRERRAALTTSSWMRVTSKSCWCCTSNLRRPVRLPNAPWYVWVGIKWLWHAHPNVHVIPQ